MKAAIVGFFFVCLVCGPCLADDAWGRVMWRASVKYQQNGKDQCDLLEGFANGNQKSDKGNVADIKDAALGEAKRQKGPTAQLCGVAILNANPSRMEHLSTQPPMPHPDPNKELAAAVWVLPRRENECRQTRSFLLDAKAVEWHVIADNANCYTFEFKREKQGNNRGDELEVRHMRDSAISIVEPAARPKGQDGYLHAGIRWYFGCFDFWPNHPGGGGEPTKGSDMGKPPGNPSNNAMWKKYPNGFWILGYKQQIGE